MKLAIAALVFAIVAVVGTGYLVVRGAGHAASVALAWLEPAVRSSLPPDLDPAEIQKRFDDALALARDSRLDPAALRDTVFWLPGALLDGRLDDAERKELSARLDRLIATPRPVES